MHRAASSSRSVADRFNSYNTCFCSETDPLTLGLLLSGRYRLYHRPMSTLCSLNIYTWAVGLGRWIRKHLLCTYMLSTFLWFWIFSLTMYLLLSMCLAAHLTCCHRSEMLDSGYDFISFKCLLGGLISCYTERYASLMILQLSACLVGAFPH